MQSEDDKIVVSRRRISNSDWVDETVFILCYFCKFFKTNVISKEVLFCKMSRQLNVEGFVLVESVQFIKTDE